ncbi:hypothetical protein [Neisseria mucosa]|uniref:hypothetical protein n=1 Tax=Neisseria mucosa TaxID=488 RepID=UPI0027DEB84E|nr:hypothetical protein [Neisseria mucosa]
MSNQPNLEKAVIDIASYVATAKNAESGGQGNPATISQAMVRAAIEKALQGELGKRLDNISDTLLLVQKAIAKSSTPPNPATSTPASSTPATSTPTPSAPATSTPAQSTPATSTPTPSASGNQNTGEQQPGTPVKELVRSLNFFGDSTTARIGEYAEKLGKVDKLPVINNAAGGSLASYALMSMNGSPIEIKFEVDTIPAKGRNVTVDAEIIYGEGVTPFSMHSTIVMIGDDIEASIVGQSAKVKVYPRDETPHSIVAGKKYTLKLKANGGTDGICVLATAKNDINGANWSNWESTLERVKGYVEKCLSLVEPKSKPRFIVLTNWADNKTGWAKADHPYRHQLKDQYNNWLKEKYGEKVWDIEAYMLGNDVWTDTGIIPNEADKQAQRDGVMPLSLSSDGGAHFTPAVEEKIAKRIIDKAKELKYL